MKIKIPDTSIELELPSEEGEDPIKIKVDSLTAVYDFAEMYEEAAKLPESQIPRAYHEKVREWIHRESDGALDITLGQASYISDLIPQKENELKKSSPPHRLHRLLRTRSCWRGGCSVSIPPVDHAQHPSLPRARLPLPRLRTHTRPSIQPNPQSHLRSGTSGDRAGQGAVAAV